jgi:hypothetical protein
MGFLSKLLGQKQAATKRPNFEFYERVVDYTVVSDSLRDDLKIKLKQAFEDPKSFYDHHNEFKLSDRGLTYPKDTLLTPKFVLVDTLQDNGQMAEVDWKEEESEIRTGIGLWLQHLTPFTQINTPDPFQTINSNSF